MFTALEAKIENKLILISLLKIINLLYVNIPNMKKKRKTYITCNEK